jgi:hypothetical protein
MRHAVTIAALSLAFFTLPVPGTSAADDPPPAEETQPERERDYTMTDNLRELRRERYDLFTAITSMELALIEQPVIRSQLIPIRDEPLSAEQWEDRKEQWRRLADQNAKARESRRLIRERIRAFRIELRIVERQIRLLEERIKTAQSWGHAKP